MRVSVCRPTMYEEGNETKQDQTKSSCNNRTLSVTSSVQTSRECAWSWPKLNVQVLVEACFSFSIIWIPLSGCVVFLKSFEVLSKPEVLWACGETAEMEAEWVLVVGGLGPTCCQDGRYMLLAPQLLWDQSWLLSVVVVIPYTLWCWSSLKEGTATCSSPRSGWGMVFFSVRKDWENRLKLQDLFLQKYG